MREMNRDDRDYLERRARQERERANTSANSAIALVHSTLAAEYEERLKQVQAVE